MHTISFTLKLNPSGFKACLTLAEVNWRQQYIAALLRSCLKDLVIIQAGNLWIPEQTFVIITVLN